VRVAVVVAVRVVVVAGVVVAVIGLAVVVVIVVALVVVVMTMVVLVCVMRVSHATAGSPRTGPTHVVAPRHPFRRKLGVGRAPCVLPIGPASRRDMRDEMSRGYAA
jgi:hypothetical protein